MPLTRDHWRKSSYSGQSGSCVEVGAAPPWVGVRGTKDRRDTLTFSHEAWPSFIATIKTRHSTA